LEEIQNKKRIIKPKTVSEKKSIQDSKEKEPLKK